MLMRDVWCLMNRIAPMLQHNIDVTLHWNCPSTVNTRWTNNSSESANHKLKIAVDWKHQSLLSLIEHLSNVVQSQYEELERAIINNAILNWTRISISVQETHGDISSKKIQKNAQDTETRNRIKRLRYQCGSAGSGRERKGTSNQKMY